MPSSSAKWRNNDEEIPLPYEADTYPNQLKVVAGKLGIRQGDSNPEVGEPITWRIRGQIDVSGPSSLVLADGAEVQFDLSADPQAVVATGGTVGGVCVGGFANGETTLRVLLNGQDAVV